jgi:hypothetical protein
MRITMRLFVICLTILCPILVQAQGKKQQKWQTAIVALEKSDFTRRYVQIKDSIENQMTWFHRYKSQLSQEEIAEVRTAYLNSCDQFDRILNTIKTDFSDPKQRAYLEKNPDRFSNYLQAELNNALTAYNQGPKQLMDSYVRNDLGALGLMEISMIIALGKEIYSIYDNNKKKTAGMSEKYFEDHFVSKHKLKRWEHY